MIPHDPAVAGLRLYVCPRCKGKLKVVQDSLHCAVCKAIYPILEGIPDFVAEDLTRSSHPILKGVRSLDLLARIYESRFWYPLALNLYGGLGSTSLEQLVKVVSGIVKDSQGLVLDAACGPGTFGRRIASESKAICGIDISMGMLRQGAAYAKRDHIGGIQFARARVEALPFDDSLFDAAICCGALHLFGDTVLALREIARTMKPGAPLAVFTFTAGPSGVLRSRWVREHVRRDHGVHIFEVPELQGYLSAAAFECFQPEAYGSVLTFSAIKSLS